MTLTILLMKFYLLLLKKQLWKKKILNTSLPELLEIGNDLLQQTNNENATGYQQKIENFYQENKEVTQTLVASLQDEITHLKSEIEFLRALWDK